MDQNKQEPALETAAGTAVVFLIVLVSALLMMRYDGPSWLADWMRSNARESVVANPPIPPL